MSTVNDALIHSFTDSQALLHRYTADLTPPEYLHRPTPKANCTAWLIGHLILSDRRLLGLLGVNDPPPLPEGFEKRFGRDGDSASASDFGDVSILMPLFDRQRAALTEALKHATVEQIDQPLPTAHPLFKTTGEMINFMSLHVALHAGQITIIRRSLGRPPVV